MLASCISNLPAYTYIVQIWKLRYNGTGMNIAVIDSGFDIRHDDLASSYVSIGK